MTSKHIKCIDGPYEGHFVDAKMGDKWPYVLWYTYGDTKCLIGWYEINLDNFTYRWIGQIEECRLKN
jgi:hypothetical protein